MYEHARDRYSVSDIARIAVKHQHCNSFAHTSLWGSNVKCGEVLAVRCRYHQVFKVGDAELGWPRDFCSSIIRNVGGVDKSSVSVSMRPTVTAREDQNALLLEIQQGAERSSDALGPM